MQTHNLQKKTESDLRNKKFWYQQNVTHVSRFIRLKFFRFFKYSTIGTILGIVHTSTEKNIDLKTYYKGLKRMLLGTLK